jgi:hypothetical protein
MGDMFDIVWIEYTPSRVDAPPVPLLSSSTCGWLTPSPTTNPRSAQAQRDRVAAVEDDAGAGAVACIDVMPCAKRPPAGEW